MTRYALDKVLWEYGRDPAFKAGFDADPASAIAGRELGPAERAALVAKDIRAVFSLGAHPFLVYSFAIAHNGGWSVEFMHDYVDKLKGLELGDIET